MVSGAVPLTPPEGVVAFVVTADVLFAPAGGVVVPTLAVLGPPPEPPPLPVDIGAAVAAGVAAGVVGTVQLSFNPAIEGMSENTVTTSKTRVIRNTANKKWLKRGLYAYKSVQQANYSIE